MAGRGFLAWLSCEGYGRMRREYTPRRRSGDLVVVGGGQGGTASGVSACICLSIELMPNAYEGKHIMTWIL